MTLAERRARRFAELVGGEVEAWDEGYEDASWFIHTKLAEVCYDGECPEGELSLKFCSVSSVEVGNLVDTLRQVLTELPDEWTEEELADAKTRAGETMERIDWQ